MPRVEQELLTLPEHLSPTPVFSGVRVARSFVFDAVFSRSLFVVYLLCCLFVLDLRILITSLVSSNSSYIHIIST